MRDLASHTRVYLVFVVLAGYVATGRLLLGASSLPAGKWAILVLLALACGPIELSFRRAKVPVSLIFVFVALFELPGRYAALVAMAAAASHLQFGSTRAKSLRDWLAGLSTANVALFLAQETHRSISAISQFQWVSMAAAAAVLFLVTSTSRATARALDGGDSLGKTWKTEFLHAAPVYLLMASAAALLGRLLAPAYLNAFVLGFPVVCLLYYCYEFYLSRQRTERRHAQEISEIYRRTSEALILAVDAKDRITSGHLRRVQRYSLEVADYLGCTPDERKALEIGALLHDIGKIAVPEHLLAKPAKLTRKEFNQVAIHPQVGAEILEAVNFPFPVAELVHCHHENWDGSGYPRGLRGTEIPRTSRILSVVDCFDALISDRPYRPAFPLDQAIATIQERRGNTFDPQVVDALIEVLKRSKGESAGAKEDDKPRVALRSPRSIDAIQTSRAREERPSASVTLPEGDSLRRIYDSVGSAPDLEQIVDAALSELGRVTPHDACAVFVLEDGVLVSKFRSWPLNEGRGAERVSLREGPTGWCAARGETMVNGNPAMESGDLGWMAQVLGWQDALIVPLWESGAVIGTLNLYSAVPHAYTQDHARYLELMTANLGISLAKVLGTEAVPIRKPAGVR